MHPLKRPSNKRTKIDFVDRSIYDKTSVPTTFNVADGIDLSCTARHRSLFTGRNSVKLCRKAVFRQNGTFGIRLESRFVPNGQSSIVSLRGIMGSGVSPGYSWERFRPR